MVSPLATTCVGGRPAAILWASTIGASAEVMTLGLTGAAGVVATAGFIGAEPLGGTASVRPAWILSGFLMLLARARASTLTPRRRATPPRVSPRRSVYRVIAADDVSSSARRARRVRGRRMANEKAPSPVGIGTLQQPLQSQQEQFQHRSLVFWRVCRALAA